MYSDRYKYFGAIPYRNLEFTILDNINCKNSCLLVYEPGEGIIVGFELRPDNTAEHKKKFYWTIPGGKNDERDMSIISSAIREFTEEIGVDFKKLNLGDRICLVYGKKHGKKDRETWTIMVSMCVDNLKLFYGDKGKKDKEMTKIGYISWPPNNLPFTEDIFMGKDINDITITTIGKPNGKETGRLRREIDYFKVSPKLLYPDLFNVVARSIGFYHGDII